MPPHRPTSLWLLPFYPSPLKDDGYDIADYAGLDQILMKGRTEA